MALTLEGLKAQCRIEYADNDPLLGRLLAAAQKHVERHLGYALDDSAVLPAGVPEDLEHAVYMLAAHWHENPEAVLVGQSAQVLPLGVTEIIAEHRRYTFGLVDDGE